MSRNTERGSGGTLHYRTLTRVNLTPNFVAPIVLSEILYNPSVKEKARPFFIYHEDAIVRENILGSPLTTGVCHG